MLILGIDPGVAIVGYGLVKNDNGKVEYAGAGCIRTENSWRHAERLARISMELSKIIEKYKPGILSIEELFFCKNVKTALKVGEARGVILATAMRYKLAIYEFTPLEIKQAVTSYGRADKRQIQEMVRVILGLAEIIKPDDASDALAAAITCVHTGKRA